MGERGEIGKQIICLILPERSDPKPLGLEGGREDNRANADIGCPSKSQEREESLHILTKTACILNQRFPQPKPSDNRKVENTQNTQFSPVAGKENTLVADNREGDATSEQGDYQGRAAQEHTRGKEMIWPPY